MNKGGIPCLIILLTILSVSSVYGEEIQNIESKDNISTVEIEKDFQELKSKINTLDENISEIDYKQYVKRLENLEGKYIDVIATSQTVNLWITILLVVLSLVVGGTWIQNRNFDKQAKKELKEITDAKEKALEKISNLGNIADKKIEEISKKAKEVHLEIITAAEKQRQSSEYLSEGIKVGREGDLKESIKYFDKSIKITPNSVIAYYNKGISLSKLEKYKESIKCFDAVLKLDTKYIDAYCNKGISLSKLEKYKDAIINYDKALTIDSKHIDTFMNKGLALGDLEKYEESIKCFDEILKLDPKNVDAYFNKGTSLYKLEKYKESIKCFDEVLKLDPKNIDAYFNRGVVFSKISKLDEMMSDFDKIIKIDKEYIDVYYAKACGYSLLNTVTKIFKNLNQAFELNYFENKENRASFYQDEDFDNIRETKEFKEFEQKVKDKYGDE